MDYEQAEVRLMIYCLNLKCSRFIKIMISLDILSGAMVLTVGSLMTIDFFSFHLTYQQQRSLITYVTCAFIIYGVSCIILGISLFIMRWKISLVKFGGTYLVAKNVLTCLQLIGFIFMLVLVLSFNNSTHMGMSSISDLFGGFSQNNPQNFQLLINAKLMIILLISCLGILMSLYGCFLNWLIQESLPLMISEISDNKQSNGVKIVRKRYKPCTVVPDNKALTQAYIQNTIISLKENKNIGDSFTLNSKITSTERGEEAASSLFQSLSEKTKKRKIKVQSSYQ